MAWKMMDEVFDSLKTMVFTKEDLEACTETIPGVPGGWFDRTGYHMTDEEKKHLSEVTKGVPKSLEHRKAIAKGATGNKNWLGKKHSEESKKRMSEAQKTKYLQFTFSDESIKKMSESHKGKRPSAETKAKMVESQKKRWEKRRQICQY